MQFAYRIDLWDADGNSVVKHLADPPTRWPANGGRANA